MMPKAPFLQDLLEALGLSPVLVLWSIREYHCLRAVRRTNEAIAHQGLATSWLEVHSGCNEGIRGEGRVVRCIIKGKKCLTTRENKRENASSHLDCMVDHHISVP